MPAKMAVVVRFDKMGDKLLLPISGPLAVGLLAEVADVSVSLLPRRMFSCGQAGCLVCLDAWLFGSGLRCRFWAFLEL